MTQERALEIAQSIWGDIGYVKVAEPELGVGTHRVGWQLESGAHCTWYGDNWEDAFDVTRRCVMQAGWPDPYHPAPDEASYILQQLDFAGV